MPGDSGRVAGRVFGSRAEGMTLGEAFAGVALSSIVADGVVTEEETRGLMTTLRRMDLYRGLQDAALERLVDDLFARLREHGEARLLRESAEGISDELRPTAFAVAADLVMADRRIDEKETRALEDLRGALKVDARLAEDIVRVLRIKNRV